MMVDAEGCGGIRDALGALVCPLMTGLESAQKHGPIFLIMWMAMVNGRRCGKEECVNEPLLC